MADTPPTGWYEDVRTRLPQPGFYTDFLEQLTAIEAHTRAVRSLIPEQTVALSKVVHDVYKDAGKPSRGRTPDRSTSGRRSGSSTLDGDEVPGGDEGSRTLPKTWRQRADLPPTDSSVGWLHFPGAHPSAVDYLDMMSIASAKMAKWRQQKLDTQAQSAARERLVASLGGDESQITDAQRAELDAITGSDTRIGKVSDAFASAKKGYTLGRYVSGMVQDIMRPITAQRDYAYETGYQGGSPIALGLRSPLGAAASGFGQRMSQLGFAFNNNVTPHQAAGIYNELFSRGWYGGGSTDAMRTTAARMMQQNPYIAQMPEYYTMMDRATRFGATSLNNFNKVMMQVSDVAKGAHTSIAGMVGQMDQLGMFNTQMGGNYIGGLQNAIDWSTVTGLPPALMQQAMQNPLVIGQTFAATGLMPQMQGLASPFQHAQGIFGALNLLNRSMVTPGNRNYIDPITGLKQTISGQDQKEALLASQFNLPKDVIHTMLTNQKGWMAGMEIANSAETYQQTILRDTRTGGNISGDLNGAPWSRLKQALKTAVDSQGHKVIEDWSYYHNLKHPSFWGLGVPHHYSDAEAHKLAQQHAMQAIQHAGDKEGHWEYSRVGAGRGGSNRRTWVPGDPTKVAADRAAMIKHYQQMNTSKFGPGNQRNNGPALTIELGPAAKKVLYLSDPTKQQKGDTNAGSASINLNSWVTGQTSAPNPPLDTAGGSSTYYYGGPNDYSGQ